MKFNNHTAERVCGKTVQGQTRVDVACLRTANHLDECVAMAGEAASADGVKHCCRVVLEDAHTEWCPLTSDVLCNLCGLSCVLTEGEFSEKGGLINAQVEGGYRSTPGNGQGALDDMTVYTFSLCEFCLDWLFSQFNIPVESRDSCTLELERWKPASERVAADDWRKLKKEFLAENARRSANRKIGK